MNSTARLSVLAAALAFGAFSFAQAPAGAPEGSTGQCRDGTYTSSASKRGACSGHKGVQQWYATDSGAAASTSAPASAPVSAPAPAGAAPVAPTPAPPAKPAAANTGGGSFVPPANAAPGGGPGLVWVNSSSNVYHCPGDRWYGKTKAGEYLSEADAKARGARPDHGKACQ
jgi:hypothetical protein